MTAWVIDLSGRDDERAPVRKEVEGAGTVIEGEVIASPAKSVE